MSSHQSSQSKKTQAAQVYFPIDMYMQIKQIARAQNKPLATWIRDLVVRELNQLGKGKAQFSDLTTYRWKTDENDLSTRVDEAVYGA